ncbi:unnamed protein product [Protopolystoma xenopodis]|uniref:Uncharacterized protein n=1 Tax=Protopolystoma xenopodis TaxID=117903 RepID=A0A3S5FHF6_9PLAT|nr:unnamed protein product [Protopolystoma xenopodis]
MAPDGRVRLLQLQLKVTPAAYPRLCELELLTVISQSENRKSLSGAQAHDVSCAAHFCRNPIGSTAQVDWFRPWQTKRHPILSYDEIHLQMIALIRCQPKNRKNYSANSLDLELQYSTRSMGLTSTDFR